jgi:Mg2+ and Co2+ transporter CorA
MDENAVADARNHHQVLQAELDVVMSSYRQAIDGMQQAVKELNDNLFADIRNHLEDVESKLIRNSLANTNTKIKTLNSLCNSVSSMESIILNLQNQYMESVDQNIVVSDTEQEHGAKCSLEFDMSESEGTISP